MFLWGTAVSKIYPIWAIFSLRVALLFPPPCLLWFFLFNVDHLLSLCWICYNIASVVYVLIFWPQGVWDPNSLTRDQTLTSCCLNLNCGSHSVVADSLWPHGLYSPWNSPGQTTGEGSLYLLQGSFPIQGLNPGLPHCRWILYQLSHKRSWLRAKWE